MVQRGKSGWVVARREKWPDGFLLFQAKEESMLQAFR